MQRILGPSSVVVFSITRTIYSMSRQALSAITQALGQEITELYGKHALTRLFRLYELSERVIFAMIPVVSMGTLLATPVLIAVWLHKPTLYDPYVCIIMALIGRDGNQGAQVPVPDLDEPPYRAGAHDFLDLPCNGCH